MSKFIKTAAALIVFGAFSTVTMAGGVIIILNQTLSQPQYVTKGHVQEVFQFK